MTTSAIIDFGCGQTACPRLRDTAAVLIYHYKNGSKKEYLTVQNERWPEYQWGTLHEGRKETIDACLDDSAARGIIEELGLDSPYLDYNFGSLYNSGVSQVMPFNSETGKRRYSDLEGKYLQYYFIEFTGGKKDLLKRFNEKRKYEPQTAELRAIRWCTETELYAIIRADEREAVAAIIPQIPRRSVEYSKLSRFTH